MGKDFKTYIQQMERLHIDKNIECSDDNHKAILIQNGYFNLVNGYKLPFTSSKNAQNEHIYETGTSIYDLHAVKRFDDELRLVLFKQIVRVEEEMRTLTGYKFDEATWIS